MSEARATQDRESGRVDIGGRLDANSVPGLLASIDAWLTAAADPLTVELSNVERADSAGVALLLEVQRRVRAAGRSVEFIDAPEQMRAIIGFCALEQVLPLR